MVTEQTTQGSPETAHRGASTPRDTPIKPPMSKSKVLEMRMCRSDSGSRWRDSEQQPASAL